MRLSSSSSSSSREGDGKPLQYSCHENPMNSMKRQTDMTLKDKQPRLVGVQYATGKEQRNTSRKNEGKNVKLSLFDNSVIVTKSKLALLTGQQAKKFTNRC